jgi:hypothetical protein
MITITAPQSFPDLNESPEKKKGKEFQKAFARAVWSRYSNGGTYFGYSQLSDFQTLRLYSNGMQPAAPYKEWFSSKDTRTELSAAGLNSRKGYANVDFRIWSPAAKYKSVIQSIMASTDYRVLATSSNPTALNEKMKVKWNMYLASRLGKDLSKVGIPTPTSYWMPQNIEELEMYDRLGGFKLLFETAIEDIAQHTFDISHWDNMRALTVEDAIDMNFLIGKVYTDMATGATKIKHIKPANVVMAWIDDDTESAPQFIGHLTKVKLSEIKQTLLSEGYTMDDLATLAKTYYPAQNQTYPFQYFTELDPLTNRWRWEDFNVDVLEYEFVSYDEDYYTYRETKEGSAIYEKEEDRRIKKDYGDGRKRTTDIIGNQVIYQGKYCVGSDIVYDYGLQANMMREDKNTVYSSYFFERILGGASITERCLPLYDSVMKSWLKLQAAKWAATPKGYSIDISSLSNINLGDGVMNPNQLISMARQNGIFAYKKRIEMGKVISGSDAIIEREGGIGRQLEEWLTAIAFDLNQIMDFSGITPTMAASPSQSDDKLKGVMQMEIESTNNALYPIKSALVKFKEKAAKAAIMKTLVNIKYDAKAEEYYTKIIGQDRMNAIKQLDQTTLDDLTIVLEALPNTTEKQMMLDKLEKALQVGRDGKGRLSTAEYFQIEQLMRKDKLKEAAAFLALSEERALKREAEAAQGQIQANAEAQMQSNQMAIQGEIQKETILTELRIKEKVATINAELMKEERVQKLKNEGVLEQITLEATLEATTGKEITGKV